MKPPAFLLITPETIEDKNSYHAIRQAELFEAFGRHDYNPNSPAESKEGHFPLLLKRDHESIATVRLDTWGDALIIRLLAVKKDEQGKGIGRSFIQEIENKARAMGAKRLLVNAEEDAIDFYKKTGFDFFEWDPEELKKPLRESCMQMAKAI